jgi:hypothetical protein
MSRWAVLPHLLPIVALLTIALLAGLAVYPVGKPTVAPARQVVR